MASIGGIPGGNYALARLKARAALRADVALARQDWDQDDEAAALSPREAARSIRDQPEPAAVRGRRASVDVDRPWGRAVGRLPPDPRGDRGGDQRARRVEKIL
jgi:hypothetical protein